jgi:hypothetical protein
LLERLQPRSALRKYLFVQAACLSEVSSLGLKQCCDD